MEIEPTRPIMNKVPKKYKKLPPNTPYVQVEEWEEFQNGWDFGEGGLVGKLNEVIGWINNKSN